jgi:hypothetical protein
MAFTTSAGKLHFVQGNALKAAINAGQVIVPGRANKCIQVVGGHLTARGGAVQTATSVDIADTTGTPVVAVAGAAAGLTENAQLDFDAAANVTRTTYRTPLTVNEGLQIIKAGSDVATAVSVDYYVEYIFVNP